MDIKKIEWLTRTAMLLAVTILFQNLRVLIGVGTHSQFIIGSLVNAALIITVGTTNIYAGLLISIIAPFVAFIQGQLPLPVLIPIVALGNAAIVIVYGLLKTKSQLLAVIAGALTKFIFFVIAIQVSLKLFNMKIPAKLVATFSWPQLITALTGGLISILVLKALKRAFKSPSLGQ